jgi:beta-phosphoglucomutase-like phosphatase (HAD superfamily)
VIDWDSFDAVLFDLDGVLTPTASIHERAWATMFDELFAALDPPQPPFRNDEYLTHVDGRPRYDGVRAVLRARRIERPDGDPATRPGRNRVRAREPQERAVLRPSCAVTGSRPTPGRCTSSTASARSGRAAAVVSSSRNAPEVLSAAGLAERFPVVVDGNVAARLGLAGKPAPDMFLEAARRLGATPERTIVVEDAVSGVAAGRAGGFGLVVGVDRGAGAGALTAHGADVVVGRPRRDSRRRGDS